jgi:hypothetical protein
MTPDGKPRRRYGEWAGNPQGFQEDTKRCAEEVWDRFLMRQCSRNRGHGPNGEYCKQHAKRYATTKGQDT